MLIMQAATSIGFTCVLSWMLQISAISLNVCITSPYFLCRSPLIILSACWSIDSCLVIGVHVVA